MTYIPITPARKRNLMEMVKEYYRKVDEFDKTHFPGGEVVTSGQIKQSNDYALAQFGTVSLFCATNGYSQTDLLHCMYEYLDQEGKGFL